MSQTTTIGARRPHHGVNAAGGVLYAALVVALSLLSGYGWLYVLRGLGAFEVGPRIGDALPLLQLAGADGQALLRVVVAWLVAGGVAGMALMAMSRLRRAALVGPLSLVALLVASQAAYAVARNLRFSGVVFSRRPGLGPILEAAVFTAGCVLVPRASRSGDRASPRRTAGGVGLNDLRQSGLGGGERRNATQHDGNRDHMEDERPRSRA